MTALTRILDIWNDQHHVRASDLSDMSKNLMPIYINGARIKGRGWEALPRAGRTSRFTATA